MLRVLWMKAIRLAIKALATMDPALERTRQERWVEAAAKHTARQYNLKYVPAQPVVGVRADVVFTVGGLPICGISAGSNNRIPAKIMANVIESDMRRLTRPVDWEYSVQ